MTIDGCPVLTAECAEATTASAAAARQASSTAFIDALLNDAILDDAMLDDAVLDNTVLNDALLDDTLAHNRVDSLLRNARLHALLCGALRAFLYGSRSRLFAFLPGGGRRRRECLTGALLTRGRC